MSWTKLGTLRKGKTGSLYLKIDGEIAAGETVQLQDPRKSVERLAATGKITEEQASERLAKIPDYIRYELFRAPSKE